MKSGGIVLILELGFYLVLDPMQPYGFDVARTVPSARLLRAQLRRLDPELLQTLLRGTVTALQAEIPGLGEMVAFNVKHIYAWVKENNPRQYIKQDRYDKDQQLLEFGGILGITCLIQTTHECLVLF